MPDRPLLPFNAARPERPPLPAQIQTLLDNIRTGGDLTTGDLTQIISYFPPSRRQPPICPQQIPPASQNFVGRQSELVTLHQQLQHHRSVAITAIADMGGIGKSELALQYAVRYARDYPGGMLWLDARQANFAEILIRFADTYLLEIPEPLRAETPLDFQLQYCLQHWNACGPTLLILDDVNRQPPYPTLLQTLPPQFRVLLTTRCRDLDPSFAKIRLEQLPLEQGLELLERLLGSDRLHQEGDDARQLYHWVDGLPLGLELLGRYLAAQPFLPIATLLERLSLEDAALQRSQGPQMMTAERGIVAAFEVSWQALSAATQPVACILGLVGFEAFPWKLVAAIATEAGMEETAIDPARDELFRQSWLQPPVRQIFRLHPLIFAFLQGKLSQSEQDSTIRQAFAAALIAQAKEIPQTITRDRVAQVEPWIPYLQQLAQHHLDWLEPEEWFWVFVALGHFYQGQGLYSLAEPWYRQCVKAVGQQLGEDHPDYAASLHHLGRLYNLQGRYREAEPLFQKDLAITRQRLGEDHPDYATSLNNLAGLYHSQGRYGEAESLCQQAIAIKRQQLGPGHPSYVLSLHNLANLYATRSLNPWKRLQVYPLLIQALRIQCKTSGWNHPHTQAMVSSLFWAVVVDLWLLWMTVEALYQAISRASIWPLLRLAMTLLLLFLLLRWWSVLAGLGGRIRYQVCRWFRRR